MKKVQWGILGTADIARGATIPGMQQAETKTVSVPNNYRLEVEQLGRCILEGARPHVTREFSLLAARTTDRVLSAIGY